MHLVIAPVGADLPASTLSALDPLLAQADIVHRETLSPLDPHTALERLLGRLRGLPADAALPLAAWQLDERQLPWAFVGPLHVQLEASQALALDPSLLDLDAVQSHACWELLAELFPAGEGWERAWLDPLTWAVAHPQLAGLSLASRERVVDRPLTPWLPEDRRIRRWTNEAQMLLHAHAHAHQLPGQGLKPNSIWFWGAGQHAGEELPEDLRIDERLKAALQRGDMSAIEAAWAELIAQIPTNGLLSLVGEQGSVTLRLAPRPWWQRWMRRGPRAAELIAGL